MKDRRMFARINKKFNLRFLNPIDDSEGEAETVDISANGLGLVTKKNLSIGIPLEIWLNIPDGHAPLYTRGKVVWSKILTDNIHQRIGVCLEKADLMVARVLRKSNSIFKS